MATVCQTSTMALMIDVIGTDAVRPWGSLPPAGQNKYTGCSCLALVQQAHLVGTAGC